VKCKHCKQEQSPQRFPLGFACVCGTEGCAGNEAGEFWLTPEAAQRGAERRSKLE